MVEIRNIPETNNEDVQYIVKKVYKILQIPQIIKSNIYRRGKNNSSIIIEYSGTSERETLLNAIKTYNFENKENP